MADAITAALVDDSDDDLKIANRLKPTGIVCAAIRPPNEENSFERLTEQLRTGNYDVVLLDYRLDDEVQHGYRGGTVAARLKEFHPDLPVVLVTTEEKHEQWVRHNPRVAALFDHVVLKEDLSRGLSRAQRAAEIHDLVASYRLLKAAAASMEEAHSAVARLAKATPEDRFAPSLRNTTVRTPELASWFLLELLAYPGPVLPLQDAVARLGITLKAAHRPAVQAWLATAAYAGVFGAMRPRWWRGRIDQHLISDKRDVREASSEDRAAFISDRVGERIAAAHCVWCGESFIERACVLCAAPVDAAHYLVGNVDDRPAWAEPARVCFRCIAQGKAESVRFVTGAEQIAHRLRAGDLKRPA